MKPFLPRLIHHHFVKTPVITDTLQLQIYQRGQWIRLAWCDAPSRYYGMNERGNVTAFHYPSAGVQFCAYCAPTVERRRELLAKHKAVHAA